MEDLETIVEPNHLLPTIGVILVVIVILSFIKRVLIKKVAYKDGKGKRNTFMGMVFNILQYVVIIGGIFAILSINGVNVTGMLAGLGVVATIVGLSLQDTFKDLFAGLNIYNNNFYKVGDFVRYNGEICEVKFFNARISKFSSIYTNSTYTVSNSTIYNIEKIKDTWVNIYIFNYEDDKELILKTLDIAAKKADKVTHVTSAFTLGLLEFNTAGASYGILYKVAPKFYLDASIEVSSIIMDEFKKAGLRPSCADDRNLNMMNPLITKKAK